MFQVQDNLVPKPLSVNIASREGWSPALPFNTAITPPPLPLSEWGDISGSAPPPPELAGGRWKDVGLQVPLY